MIRLRHDGSSLQPASSTANINQSAGTEPHCQSLSADK